MVTSTARSRNKNIEAIYPLTPLQQGMLFHTLLESETGVYVQQLSCTLHGALDTEALERAWQRVVERHSVLRTAFIWEELKQSLQVVGRKVNLPLEQQDWRELSRDEQEQRLEAFLQQERRTGFKLSKSPLMRLNLIRTAADVHQFVLTYHHLLLDGWSLPILLKEVFSFYEAFRRGQDLHLKQTRPYVDYINWLQQQDETKAEGFWRATLKGFLSPTPLGEKPLATASQASREEAYSAEKTHLSRALTASLQALARQHQLTMSTLVQGAWAVLLARYSGQRDVLFGATTSGRPATLAGAEAMVGLFINTLPVRVEVNSEKEVVAWLKQLQHELVEMREHEHSALIQIHGWSEVPRGLPLFDSILVFQNYPLEESLPEQVGSLSIRGIRTFDQTNYALTLAVTPGAQMSLELAYDCRRFDAATIRRLLGHLQTVLEGMAANPERKLARLPLLTPAEEQQLAQWNRTQKNYPLEKCLHELFEAQAASTPLAIAARCEGRQLTYGELNGRANQLANYLRRLGVGADVLVGICAERSLDFVVGMLGVFKAGGAYVPLDPAYPKERLSFLLENSRVTILLTQQRLLDALPEHGATVVCLDADWAHVAHESEATLESVVVPANLAYVIYTSGSTGLPKGAMIEHRSMLNHLFIKAETLGLSSGDVVAQTASQCFDISVWQMLSVLLAGGRVEIFPDEVAHDPWLLAERVTQTGVTVLESVPSFLRILVEQGAGRAGEGQGAGVWGSLRWMLATGEALPPQLCRQWLESYPSIPLVNAYGPTECGDDVTQAVIIESPGEDVARMPIGRALSNLQLYVLDAEMRELPVGCSGELYVGGVGVGRGYLRDGGRTAERFVPDAFGGAEGARLYRTGDVVRRREDGELEYLGRVDEQVKVRGNRIELGEVEAALEGLEEVREAVALVWDEAGGSRLVAYVVPKAQAASPVEKEGAPKELEKVAQWQTVFDQVYRQETVSEQDEAVNLSVWISSYTRESLPENEIAESVEDSVKRILSLGPRRVLELGCGTGLLLSRIAPHCEYYCGTDISEAVVESLKRRLERSRASLPEIKLLQRAADDLEGIEAGSFDVVVINELVQYLPSADYLVRVIEGALKMLRPGGCIFVGGVRSLPLLEAFHLSVQLAQSTPDASVEQLQQRVRKAVAQDKELVIDPDFFIALKQRTPQISDVEIQLKGGEHDNELTKFRYDVILRAGQESVASTEIDWLDWRRGGLNVDDVRRMLREDEPPLLAVKNVPNLRLVRESRALELLSASARPATVGELKELVAGTNRAIAPASFWAIGEELPYDVQVCWSEAGEAGSYDLLFRRRSVLAHNAGHVALPRKSLEPKPWAQYANNPLLDISTEQLIPKLRRRMKETLPDYMIPSAFVLMDALPLTTNGKVDRRQLPAPEQTRPEMEKAYVAPRNSTEEKLSAICAEALRLERVGVYDNFFELGGHSLLAIQVLSRVQKTFQIDLPLRAVFETPTIAGLAQKIEEALSSGQAVAATPIERVARDGELELSHAQQRLWILDQLEPGSSFYNIPGAVRLTGQLKVEVLERSFSEIIRRHETLRTTFVVKDGKPLQHISQAEPRELAVIDIAGLPGAQQEEEVGRLATAEAERPFDLAQGPLLRMKLLRLSEEEHVLLVTMHHIISDGWSMGVLIREVAALYEAYSAGEASPLPELEIQYADYAAWQRKWLAGEMLQEQLRYWKGQLAGAPPLL
ncbi:MAG TPA: amino acid adenylation domain-containing protein, partial [Pyrinomonadaceae bacterium]